MSHTVFMEEKGVSSSVLEELRVNELKGYFGIFIAYGIRFETENNIFH